MRTNIRASAAAVAFPAETSLNWKAETPGRNGTLIAVVLDESGSMNSCWDATIDGFNEFVNGQKNAEEAGQAYLTLVKFDAPQIHTVCTNVNVKSVEPLNRNTYRPNGGTNLMDAIGQTLNNVNSVLSSVPQDERPSVMVVIITDGGENASREFNGEQIKTMVKAAEAQDWLFTFLGANVDAFAMGQTFGMNASNSVNYSTASMAATMDVLTKTTVNVRSAKMRGVSTADLYGSQALYSATDRSKTMGQ